MATKLITAGANNNATTQNSFLPTDGGTVFDNTRNLIVLSSNAFNLTTDDTNGVRDVYLYNQTTGTFTNLTLRNFNGTLTTQLSQNPSISGNGQRVVFESEATNLSNVTANAVRNIYVADNPSSSPTLRLITNGFTDSSFNPSISNDSNWIVYETSQDQDGGGIDGADRDIVLHRLATGTNIWVSQISGGGGNVIANSTNASVSGDGRYVVFQTDGFVSDFIPGVSDTNGALLDILLFDNNDQSLRLVSRTNASPTTTGNGASLNAAISSDGRYIVYQSAASDLLAAGDTNGVEDIFVYEINTGQNTRINLRPGAIQTTAGSSLPAINANGDYVAFASDDAFLVNGDTNGLRDIFRWQRSSGTITRVSVDSNGNQANQASTNPSISPDGNQVAFESSATNLGQPVQGGVNNVFVNDNLINGGNGGNGGLNTPVYRFYNSTSRGHFFTTNTAERDNVLANPQFGYTFEGVGFNASATPGANLLPVYRFYNSTSRGHFFTTNTAERDNVLANPQLGYTFEGVGFYAYGAEANLGSDIYRFYNSASRGHFFTINPTERDTVLANPQLGYTFEGVGFEASPA